MTCRAMRTVARTVHNGGLTRAFLNVRCLHVFVFPSDGYVVYPAVILRVYARQCSPDLPCGRHPTAPEDSGVVFVRYSKFLCYEYIWYDVWQDTDNFGVLIVFVYCYVCL